MQNEMRNMAIYLTRNLRRCNLTEIGKEFKVGSYSTISTIIDRMKDRMANDKKVNRLMDQLKENLNMSQLRT
jgi:chromosomal replication initiation ATPase DnaA